MKVAVFHYLESRHLDEQCWEQKQEPEHYQEKDEFPDEAEPFLVRYLRNRKHGKKDTGTRSNHIRKSVTELECQNRSLT